MVVIVDEFNGMINVEVIKFGHIQSVIAWMPIGINNAVRLDFLTNDRQ